MTSLSLARSPEPVPYFRPYNETIKEIVDRAADMVNPDPLQEETYLHWLTEHLMILDAVPDPAPDQWLEHPRGEGVQVFRQRIGRVEICHLQISPYGKIPYHDHYRSNGVMKVLEGSVTTRNYDIVKLRPEGVVLQLSLEARLTTGRMVSFCQCRNNVHNVVAGANGARILDVFTRLGDDSHCRYLDLQQSGAGNLVNATWSDQGEVS